VVAHDLDEVDFDSVFSRPSTRLRSFLSRFDRAIVWMRDDGTIRSAFEQCGIAEVTIFPGLPPENWREHASRYYLTCHGFGEAPPLHLQIEPGASSYDVVIHPGSGKRSKNWPLARFQAVAEYLEGQGRRVIWCLGPAEENYQLPQGAAVLRTESLVTLARELAGARLYLGNDSGITHLAAGVGCPTVAVFGPSDPRVWSPQGCHITVVHAQPWPEVADVLPRIPTNIRSLGVSPKISLGRDGQATSSVPPRVLLRTDCGPDETD
jgi:hypothetical protein